MLFLLSSFIVASSDCEKYSCPNDDIEFPVDGCVMRDNGTVWVQPCGDSIKSYCDVQDSGESYCVKPTSVSAGKYPGEKCTSAEDCVYSSACVEGVCLGAARNESCADSHYCSPNLYCALNNTCQPSSNTECNTNYDCSNSHVCSGNKCVKYFSIDEDKDCGTCTEGVNSACKSNSCYTSGTNSFCLPTLAHASKGAIECTENADCKSEPWGKQNFTANSECVCGKNPTGKSYCALLPNDEVYKEYIKLAKDWFESEKVKNCNTLRRDAYACIKDWWSQKNYIKYVYYRETLIKFASLQAIDYCTESVFYADYSEIKGQFEHIEDFNFENAAALIVGSLILALI